MVGMNFYWLGLLLAFQLARYFSIKISKIKLKCQAELNFLALLL